MSDRAMGENESLFGPSNFGGKKSLSLADIMAGGSIVPGRPVDWNVNYQRDADTPPFKKGDRVVQIDGPQQSRNARRPCVVDDVRFVRSVDFTGWAIKLVGRAKPYDAEMFRLIEREIAIEQPAEQEPIRVLYDSRTQEYLVEIENIGICLVPEIVLRSGRQGDIEEALSEVPTRLLHDVIAKLMDAVAVRTDANLRFATNSSGRTLQPGEPVFLDGEVIGVVDTNYSAYLDNEMRYQQAAVRLQRIMETMSLPPLYQPERKPPVAPSLPLDDVQAPMPTAPRRRIIRPKKPRMTSYADFGLHVAVQLRGGPLDGQEWRFSPIEYGSEIRIAGIVTESHRVVLRELFYVPVGYRSTEGTPLLVADYVATQDTELPRIK